MQSKSFPPNLDPHVFSLLAVGVAYALVGDYDVNEQNSIGNWFELLGQYMLTHAAQQQVIESRIEHSNININSKKYKKTGNPYTDNNQNKSNQNQRSEVEFLLDAVQRLQDELNNLKK